MFADHQERARAYWDFDAETYDRIESHVPRSPVARVAWATAIDHILPDPPMAILDVGAGTGFLTLAASRLGHRVTAMDLSPRMLEVLASKASSEGLAVATVEADATNPPDGPFDVVMSRHLLWTLPRPEEALQSWREAAPGGRLVLFEALWDRGDPIERARSKMSSLVQKARASEPGHHAPYPDDLRSRLPLGDGIHPETLIELVEEAGWSQLRLRRLRDVEWALTLDQPMTERLLGAHPVYGLTAQAG